MSRPCPERRELLRLLDGEVTENRGAELRAHLSECGRCAQEYRGQEQLVADLAAPVPGLPSAGAADAVLRRLDSGTAPARRAPAWRPWLIGAGGLAAAAALALIVLPRGSGEQGGFTARGSRAQWTSKVGVELWALEPIRRKLAADDVVPQQTAFFARWRNVDVAAAHLLAFAIDARGEVHWLYPAFLDPREDPQAVRIEPGPGGGTFPDSVMLESVPSGPLRVVTVISRDPLRVSEIEALPASQRTAEALRARWPAARVDELPLRVAATSPEASPIAPSERTHP